MKTHNPILLVVEDNYLRQFTKEFIEDKFSVAVADYASISELDLNELNDESLLISETDQNSVKKFLERTNPKKFNWIALSWENSISNALKIVDAGACDLIRIQSKNFFAELAESIHPIINVNTSLTKIDALKKHIKSDDKQYIILLVITAAIFFTALSIQ
ncbi:hypothetical protein [Crocinitomix algicola]|uniref:hypothetical protein n=1 Tax=Crocinitomix algicola TaxID=1740263 RepID=UPI0008316760|nr:hypothetical protein [Crocinitomix algicola]